MRWCFGVDLAGRNNIEPGEKHFVADFSFASISYVSPLMAAGAWLLLGLQKCNFKNAPGGSRMCAFMRQAIGID